MRDVSAWLGKRVSYANVVASIALFVSLGGVSYAAFSLPTHSVGARALQQGAVGTTALGFPLGAKLATNFTAADLGKGGCNGGGRPGEIPPPCPPPGPFGGPSATHLRIDARHPGHLLISVIAGIENRGAADTHAEVSYAVILDERAVAHGEITVAGTQREQTPIQALVHVAAGAHTVGFQARAEYFGYGPGDVVVSPVSLAALSLP